MPETHSTISSEAGSQGDFAEHRAPGGAALAARLARLAWVSAIAVADWARLAAIDRLRRREDRASAAGRAAATACERLGPTFIKVAQMLSSRRDLIGEPMARALGRVRDRVAPIRSAAAYGIVRSSLGDTAARWTAQFDPVPVAAGSIAQVHRAVLRDGSIVAVKVKRPGLDRLMAADVALLRRLAAIAQRLPAFRNVPLVGAIDAVAPELLAQLDFGREARSNEAFRWMFDGDEIRIPVLVPELCSADVITMEYLEGLVPIEQASLGDEARENVAQRGLEMLFHMIFVEGFIHADLHPGNVFITEAGQLAVLDFGLVVRLEPRVRNRFRAFFFAMATNDGRACARIAVEMAQSIPDAFNADAFTTDIRNLVAKYFRRSAREFEVAGFVVELFDAQRRHGVRGSTAFTMTIISLLLFEGILKTLAPGFDFQRAAARFLMTR